MHRAHVTIYYFNMIERLSTKNITKLLPDNYQFWPASNPSTMFKHSTAKLILFAIFLILFENCKSVCRQSYATICDSLVDEFNPRHSNVYVNNYLTEIIIQSEQSEPMVCVNITHFYKKFGKVNRLTVVAKISGFKYEQYFYDDIRLKYMTLYKNKLHELRMGDFPEVLDLHTLSLTDNDVRIVGSGAFAHCNIQEIDLSNNHIELLREITFSPTTKVVILKNNKISYIETNAFPASVVVINLDDNELGGVHDDVFQPLIHLQELYLRGNKLKILPHFPNCKQLHVLDLSYNGFTSVEEDDFNALLTTLHFFDLSHNLISDVFFLISVNTKPRLTHNIHVDLSFNHIRSIRGKMYLNWNNSMVLSLHGNPLWCDDFEELSDFYKFSNILKSECDVLCLTGGAVPCCIVNDVEDENVETKKFFKTFNDNFGDVGCDREDFKTETTCY